LSNKWPGKSGGGSGRSSGRDSGSASGNSSGSSSGRGPDRTSGKPASGNRGGGLWGRGPRGADTEVGHGGKPGAYKAGPDKPKAPNLNNLLKGAPNNARLAAACAVAAVAHGRSLDDAFGEYTQGLSEADRSLTKAIAYGVVRERRLLETLLGSLMERPLRNEPELEALLLCGLQQLRAMRVSHHAAVSETVANVDILGKTWAKGLVNAVLRRYQREFGALEAALPETPEVRLSYPDWLMAAIQQDWSESAYPVLAAGNVAGPLTLRVNRQRSDRDAYQERLTKTGIAAQPIDSIAALDMALRVEEAVGVERLPGFAEGDASVQDASAQLAPSLLQVEPGQRVLDACAAPGGKAAHLLETIPDLDLLAIDSDDNRLRRVRDTFSRLGLKAKVLCADAALPGQWWDRQFYDRILLDAPCSGTGVIRRHPDIKWLRRPDDITTLAAQQRRLLNGLWPLLAPGGVLVYATCSILTAEGSDIIAHFLDTHTNAEEWPIDATWGEACLHGRRLAPGGNFDGFYYARLRKKVMETAEIAPVASDE